MEESFEKENVVRMHDKERVMRMRKPVTLRGHEREPDNIEVDIRKLCPDINMNEIEEHYEYTPYEYAHDQIYKTKKVGPVDTLGSAIGELVGAIGDIFYFLVAISCYCVWALIIISEIVMIVKGWIDV